MERTTQIGIGVVVLALLGGAVYKVATDDAKKGTATTTSADLPEIKADGDVDKISITNADKGEVVLEKKGDKWEVTKPLVAAANQTNVKSLLDNMKELKAKEVIIAAPNEDQKKEFQFEPTKATHVVTWKGGTKKLDATFGKSGARGQMAMVEGKPGIYAVSGYSSYLYQREVKGWRDTDIFKFDDANANQLTIDNKNGTLSFTKEGDKWAGTNKGKALERFDEEKVKDALRAFKSLTAEDFGDGKSDADTGLDKPDSKVTIQLKDGAGKYVLEVGKTSSGSSRYARKEGDSTIFVIPQYNADWALAEPSKFQKPASDAGADAGKKDAPHAGGDPHGH
jgi:hypothetical protein